uniref:Uncharacterized protein n=1 Tax=Setaria viridis TaxID=4556 RepID=A0A4U6TC65_SETVI|nr:hypothetical protein SEVIR_8G057666v2 [Setaria viridis]TKV99643.1 hypothetical protein SEVIR_8G057666v2 [Setaria viridis]TKV99645.1 hypothetical protein SEVIR_8G057666v2 [Setaria viridis]TKV99646.1 hypothetical protein SEVIR_8G057666v2 [Setaria viridis]TKV99649.1 hypothetical protein SEVIR_8G057666v2 [Setaria viridis]
MVESMWYGHGFFSLPSFLGDGINYGEISDGLAVRRLFLFFVTELRAMAICRSVQWFKCTVTCLPCHSCRFQKLKHLRPLGSRLPTSSLVLFSASCDGEVPSRGGSNRRHRGQAWSSIEGLQSAYVLRRLQQADLGFSSAASATLERDEGNGPSSYSVLG